MSTAIVRYSANKSVGFLHIVNFLVSRKIMSLEEANLLYRKFKLGEDVQFDIPDHEFGAFGNCLDSLNCTFESH